MYRRLCLLAFAAIAVFPPLLRSQPSSNSSLPVVESFFPGLKPLLEQAVRQSPRMIARSAAEALAANSLVAVRAEQLPKIGGYVTYLPGNYEERKNEQDPLTSQKSAYALNLTQPIYHWGALRDGTRIAELQQQSALGSTIETYRLLVAEIRGGYLQLILKKAGLARARAGLKIVQEELTLAQERFQKGEISEADLYSPTVNFDRTQLDLERVIEDYEWSKKTFAKLYGGEPLSDEQIPDSIPDVAVEIEEFGALLSGFAQEKEQRSFGLQNLQRDIEIEKLNYDIASTRLKPKVNLLVGTSQDEQSYTRSISDKYGVTAYYAGVRLEWSIFDGFATKAIKSNSVIRRRQLEHAYRETSASLLDNARVKLKQLEFTARSLAIDRKGLQLNEENLERVRDNVARGLSAPSELRRAEYNHAGALINTYNARVDFLVRTSDFLATILVDPAIAQLQANLR